jgi:hypothetical protein
MHALCGTIVPIAVKRRGLSPYFIGAVGIITFHIFALSLRFSNAFSRTILILQFLLSICAKLPTAMCTCVLILFLWTGLALT